MKVALLTTDNREDTRNYDAPAPFFGTAPDALLKGFAAMPDVEVHVISCAQAQMKSPGKLAPNIFFHSLHVPKNGWMRTAYLGCIRAVRRKLREIQPDIVHGQGTERDCSMSAVFSGFPNVITIHGNMRLIARMSHAKPFSFLWFAGTLEGFAVPRARGVVCITHHTQHAVSSLAKQTWIVPNAVDPSFFEIEASPAPDKPPKILCVGDIYPLKNQNAFIRALDPIAENHKFSITFLGRARESEPYGAEFFELLKTRPWCAFGGFASRDELKNHLRDTTLLALPSLEENCPMVVLEAMAAGVAVAAARVGGVPDLVYGSKTGFLFEPLDAPDTRSAIARALADLPATHKIAAEAKREARERFHPGVIAKRHLEIYKEVLG